MKIGSKFVRRIVLAAVTAAVVVVPLRQAHAVGMVVVVPASATSAGASVVGGFIAAVGVLASYDIIRRTTCAGDFLKFGGPGFDRPIKPTDNVLPPTRCPR